MLAGAGGVVNEKEIEELCAENRQLRAERNAETHSKLLYKEWLIEIQHALGVDASVLKASYAERVRDLVKRLGDLERASDRRDLGVPEAPHCPHCGAGEGVPCDLPKSHRAALESAVEHPAHYGGDTTYECIKVLEAWGLTDSFCLGNAVKYIARAGKKNPDTLVEDLEKGRWYLDREIARRKK